MHHAALGKDIDLYQVIMKGRGQSNLDQLDTGPVQLTTAAAAAAAAGGHLKLGTLVTSAMLKETGFDNNKAVESSRFAAVQAGLTGQHKFRDVLAGWL
jgi:hypothetical protein